VKSVSYFKSLLIDSTASLTVLELQLSRNNVHERNSFTDFLILSSSRSRPVARF